MNVVSVFHPAFPMTLRRSKVIGVLSIFACLVFVGFGILALYQLFTDHSERSLEEWIWVLASPLVIAFFSFGAVAIALKLRDKRPLLTVDDHGIATTWNDYGLLAWNDIRLVRTILVQASVTSSVRYLVVEPKNLQDVLDRLPQKAKTRAATAVKLNGGLTIPMHGLTAKPQEAAEAIVEYAGQMIVAKAETPPMAGVSYPLP